MSEFKVLIIGLLLTLHFLPMPRAQNVFKPEILCDWHCRSDSLLFYKEIYQEDISSENTGESTNLQGPYFNHFPMVRSDILSALRFFPELSNARIKFTYKPIKQTMNSRPSPGNIFRKKANRRYTILVNDNLGKTKGLPFEKLSFTIKIGWLGHELAHICAYEKMSNWQTFWFSVKYVFSKKFLRKVERYTDLVTIEHGLAFPLYDGTEYLLRSKDISPKYMKYTIRNGLSPGEIKCFWCMYRDERILISAGHSVDTKR